MTCRTTPEDGHHRSHAEVDGQAIADAESSGSEAELLGNRGSLQGGNTGVLRYGKAVPLAGILLAGIVVGTLALLSLSGATGRYGLQRRALSARVGLVAVKTDVADKGNESHIKCRVDEEYLNLLCYRKCSLLTEGLFPIRTSPVTCCQAHPCGLFNQRHDIGFCSGFSVAGGDKKSCPHTPGDCLEDEEFFVGQCYKRCSLLTNNEFTHRVAPATCCKIYSPFLCLMPASPRARTSAEFDRGGGNGTEAAVHGPLRSRVLPGIGPEAVTPTQAPTTVAPLSQASVTTPTLPDWYVKAVKNAVDKGKESAAGSEDLPDWTKDMTDGMGMDTEQKRSPVPSWVQDATSKGTPETAKGNPKPAEGKAAPEWEKNTLDDPTLKATVAAGEAQDAADSFAESKGGPAPMPASQPAASQEATAPRQDGESAPLPIPAPPPAAPPPVPDWAKAGGNIAEATRTGATHAAGAGKGNKKPPPVPDWATDFVADS